MMPLCSFLRLKYDFWYGNGGIDDRRKSRSFIGNQSLNFGINSKDMKLTFPQKLAYFSQFLLRQMVTVPSDPTNDIALWPLLRFVRIPGTATDVYGKRKKGKNKQNRTNVTQKTMNDERLKLIYKSKN